MITFTPCFSLSTLPRPLTLIEPFRRRPHLLSSTLSRLEFAHFVNLSCSSESTQEEEPRPKESSVEPTAPRPEPELLAAEKPAAEPEPLAEPPAKEAAVAEEPAAEPAAEGGVGVPPP